MGEPSGSPWAIHMRPPWGLPFRLPWAAYLHHHEHNGGIQCVMFIIILSLRSWSRQRTLAATFGTLWRTL